MQIVRNSEELALARAPSCASGTLALVPTMGALHAGHMALVAEAQAAGRRGRGDDLRQSDAVRRRARTSTAIRAARSEDAAMLEEAGCDLLWLPSVDDIYPAGLRDNGQRRRRVGALGRRGAAGPFRRRRDGRRQAAARGPARRRVVRRKGFPAAGGDPADGRATSAFRVEIVGVPTVREADGLALSSRNAYLSADERAARRRLAERARSSARCDPRRRSRSRGAQPRRSRRSSTPAFCRSIISRWSMPRRSSRWTMRRGEMRLIAAATIGTTRLIDNLAV